MRLGKFKKYIGTYLILNYPTVFPIPCSQDKKRRNFKRKICCSEKTTILVTIHSLALSYEVMIYDIVYNFTVISKKKLIII